MRHIVKFELKQLLVGLSATDAVESLISSPIRAIGLSTHIIFSKPIPLEELIEFLQFLEYEYQGEIVL